MTQLQQQIIAAIDAGTTEQESRFLLYKLGIAKGWSKAIDDTKEQYFISCLEMDLNQIKENPNRMFEVRHKYGDTLSENENFHNIEAPQQTRIISYNEWKQNYNAHAKDSLYTILGYASGLLGLECFDLYLQNSKDAQNIEIVEEPITFFRNNLDNVIAEKRKESFSRAIKKCLNLVKAEAIERKVCTKNFSDFVVKLNQSRYIIDELKHSEMNAAGFVVMDTINKTITACIIR